MPASPFPRAAQRALLDWFDRTGRALPFRGAADAYGVLVSEVMAQQTQVSRVATAWTQFMRAYPTVRDLSAATPADVLRAWRGLGYNRRALHLHAAAIRIMDEHAGVVPSDVATLQELPGVGPYTARAVAALAYGRPVGPVDTNVRRVLARFCGLDSTIGSKALQELADAAVVAERPGEWMHALMDLGATVCRPRRARCEECPVRAWCASTDVGAVARPERRRRGARPSFQSTSRWLRGRLLDRLRDAEPDAWQRLPSTLGEHDEAAVESALQALERDGLIERSQGHARRARLTTRIRRRSTPRAASVDV